jgi:hypothetical protein
MRKLIVLTVFVAFGCTELLNHEYEARCPDEGAAAGLPFKIAKVRGWSECYLKCPDSWVPADGFHGCHR